MDPLQYFKTHPLFEGLDEDALRALAAKTELARFGAGELILSAGVSGVEFGIVVSGRAEAVVGFGTSQRRVLGGIGEGECFGEISLMTGQSTVADVVALTEVEALVLHEEAFTETIATNPVSVKRLAQLIATRMRAAAPPEEPARAARPTYAHGANKPMRVLVVNCGSSSLKYTYYDTSSESPVARGQVESLGTEDARLVFQGPKGRFEESLPGADHAAAFDAVAALLTSTDRGVLSSLAELSVIGHRVVHGGRAYDSPTLVTPLVIETIRGLSTLAPLHNPVNVLGIEACGRLAPDVPQVAVFDTAFHAKMPPEAHLYALPKELAEHDGIRRYGFHGTSHEYVARLAARHLGRSLGEINLVTCHLGNGVSLAAVEHGRSVDTSMGMTPLEGLVMGTRSGDVDPGVLIHLLREKKMTPEDLDELLNRRSGLKGLSGLTHDMRELESAAEGGDEGALIAIQSFCYRAKKYLGAYIAALGGTDAIVFTGGIGQRSPGVRARICQGLSGMGILVDEDANREAVAEAGQIVDVTDRESRIRVLVIGTDEEAMICRQSVQAVRHVGVTQVLQKQHQRPIPVAVSAHHVHLTQEHVDNLFGSGHQLEPLAPLSQPGQYAGKEQVVLVGPKSRIERVRVLGPTRRESQVEISRTEEFKLGVDAPLRASGDLEGSPGLTLEGPAGSIALDRGAINALRHIHMSPEDALGFALRDRDIVQVSIDGPRTLTFGGVLVRVHPEFELEMHIDTDEANAAEISAGATGRLEAIQDRPTSRAR
jgi:acetate kinase